MSKIWNIFLKITKTLPADWIKEMIIPLKEN